MCSLESRKHAQYNTKNSREAMLRETCFSGHVSIRDQNGGTPSTQRREGTKIEIIQYIALGSLLIYMVYLIYYHVLPMAYFRFLLYRALKKGICTGIWSWDGKITALYLKDGKQSRYTKQIDEEVPDRFLPASACNTLKAILSDIENGVV